jgi:hypothetical protein
MRDLVLLTLTTPTTRVTATRATLSILKGTWWIAVWSPIEPSMIRIGPTSVGPETLPKMELMARLKSDRLVLMGPSEATTPQSITSLLKSLPRTGKSLNRDKREKW